MAKYNAKIDADKITNCTCPTCRKKHDVQGVIKPPWKYCNNCDTNRRFIMAGMDEEYAVHLYYSHRKINF